MGSYPALPDEQKILINDLGCKPNNYRRKEVKNLRLPEVTGEKECEPKDQLLPNQDSNIVEKKIMARGKKKNKKKEE